MGKGDRFIFTTIISATAHAKPLKANNSLNQSPLPRHRGVPLRRLGAVNEDGTLTYSFVEALVASHPGFIVRMIGGGFFLTGMLLMAYNTWRTVRAAKPAEYEAAAQIA